MAKRIPRIVDKEDIMSLFASCDTFEADILDPLSLRRTLRPLHVESHRWKATTAGPSQLLAATRRHTATRLRQCRTIKILGSGMVDFNTSHSHLTNVLCTYVRVVPTIRRCSRSERNVKDLVNARCRFSSCMCI